ncbi:hypothetical protein L210DRAFT_3739897 [Boletus edulis BED1]|uniref:Uncharacterized protein n=1 Tax=Boletus edulis BED1 TaxID=1328754 RepID=A0AAD4BZC6_BOLED|nr:hypothetical protein L210DRAFT_3739897 [Boletus edulis BED1]
MSAFHPALAIMVISNANHFMSALHPALAIIVSNANHFMSALHPALAIIVISNANHFMSALPPALATTVGSELCILRLDLVRLLSFIAFLLTEFQELLNKHMIGITGATEALKSDNQAAYRASKDNLTTWQQYLQASVETLLILEQSFYLSQQGDPNAVFSAAQQYRISDIPTKVNIALKDVFSHYGITSMKEKVDMICNIITQNHMERPVAG